MANWAMTLERLISEGVKIFDFEYPVYKADFKPVFEQLFIDYFLFEEIGTLPVSHFKHNLKLKLNLVMPVWNKIYETQELEQRILDNYEVSEHYERTSNNTDTGNTVSSNKNLYKDAPKTKVDIDKIDIVNSITKDDGTVTSSNKNDAFETWTRTMSGNIGIQTDANAIEQYWGSLRKVTEELFEKELSELFMGVY
jgi:hypothetical protein